MRTRIMVYGKSIAAVTLAVGLLFLAACGGGGGSRLGPTATRPPDTPEPPTEPAPPPSPTSNPAYHLETPRFTTHQPNVLEQIGAHHAYAKGLTGRGVRIGIDDTIVDYTQSAEFGSRVKLRDADGARLAYSRPLGDLPFGDVDSCHTDPACQIWIGDSEDDDEAHNSWVRQIVSEDGWPTSDDSVFVLDEHFPEDGSIGQLLRWWEVPTPYGRSGSHGTAVASVAAGTNLGVAPAATIIPSANNLSDDQAASAVAERALQIVIEALPTADRRQLDDTVAQDVRDDYARFDIINRSYGTRVSEISVIDSVDTARWFRTYLPKTLSAIWQTDTPGADKTIVVYAAGNDGDPVPGLGALLPYGFPELRGHSLAVAATNPRTEIIADYSNRCGPLPSDWNASRHGPHYCLVAPGTVRGLVPNASTPGRGDASSGLQGTSFAAPIVSGALALLKEHFRGTRGNSAIVRRMLDTADRSGRYADLEMYGAGHLDLQAALSPVGTLSAGQSARALKRTTLQSPAAYGSVAARVTDIELAAFDDQDFPFWVPLSALISGSADSRSLIPSFDEPERIATPAPGLDVLGLHWAELESDPRLWLPHSQWVVGLGPTSASLARKPYDGGWGYGVSFDEGGHLGTKPSGAFGTDLRSGMIWTSRAFERILLDEWTFDAKATLALSLPHYDDDAVFQATASVLSALSMRVGTESTGLTIEQPLRAESGTGMFRVENGRMNNGRRLFDVHRVPLSPDGRELRLTLRHHRDALGGIIAIEVGGAYNSGHVPGDHATNVGIAYRTTW